MPFRAEQVATQIREELAEIIRTHVRDPRVGDVTITRVAVSEDLSFARVFVSELPVKGEPSGQSVAGLDRAKGFLKRELGKRLRLRQIPELRFEADSSIETGIRMTRLIDEIAAGDASSHKPDEEDRDDT